MTTTLTPTQHFDALPDPVQAELLQIYARLSSMTQDERSTALTVVTAVAEAFVASTSATHYPTIRMLNAWAQTVRAIDHAEFPREKAV